MIEGVNMALSLEHDTLCRRCAYNLRGLSPEGHCPECNAAIAESLEGNLLKFSDPVWLNGISAGLGIRYWGLLTMVLAYVLGMCLNPVFMVAMMAGAVFNMAGALKVTSPEPGIIDPAVVPKSRRFARIAITFFLTILVLEVLAVAQSPFGSLLLVTSLQFITTAGWIICELCLLYYTKSLAERVPNAELTRCTRTIIVAIWISIGLVVAGFITTHIGFLIQRRDPSPGGFIIGLPHISFYTIPLIIGGLILLAALLGFLYTGVRILMQVHRLWKCLEEIVGKNRPDTPTFPDKNDGSQS